MLALSSLKHTEFSEAYQFITFFMFLYYKKWHFLNGMSNQSFSLKFPKAGRIYSKLSQSIIKND